MVVFYCNEGLTPEGKMTATCASNGSWTPNPAELICREPQTGGKSLISCCAASTGIQKHLMCICNFVSTTVYISCGMIAFMNSSTSPL